jgi:hypothetical protein
VLSAFWNGMAGKLAEHWAARLLTPALLFWATGALAWCWSRRPDSARGDGLLTDFSAAVEHRAEALGRLSTPAQITWLVLALLLVAGSAMAAERLTAPFLRLLEGYWPAGRPRWLWQSLVNLARRRRRQLRDEWGELRRLESRGPSEQMREGVLARRLHSLPPEELAMPTALGNILRAGELRPARRYGLDAVVVWPRLWLLLPDTTSQEISGARAGLDGAGRSIMWLVAAVAWSAFVWWLGPLVLAGAVLLYRSAVLPAALVYSDLVEAAFDLHRPALYEALRLPLPERAQDEAAAGRALTQYLWEGHAPDDLKFT